MAGGPSASHAKRGLELSHRRAHLSSAAASFRTQGRMSKRHAKGAGLMFLLAMLRAQWAQGSNRANFGAAAKLRQLQQEC